jgi:hypothetical protein
MGLGKVNESIDPCFEKRIHKAARDIWAVTAGVFTGQKTVFFDPVGFYNW